MNSQELSKVIEVIDNSLPERDSVALYRALSPTTAQLRATLEVAYQLAILNESNTLANVRVTQYGSLCTYPGD